MAVDNATINLFVNNEQAKSQIDELTAKYQELKKARKEADNAGDISKSLELQAQERAAHTKLKNAQTGILDIEKTMASLTKMNRNQLAMVYKKLRTELNGLNQDTEEYAQALQRVEAVEEQMKRSKPKANWLTSRLGGFIGGAAIMAGLQRLADLANNAFTKVSEKMADVIKTTGMFKNEVRALDKELEKIDTRTSREELLDLSRIAGKLGVEGQEDILGFVRAADRIKVALSEDLGGDVEESIRKIGKLVDIFKLKDELGLEKAMDATASAINALGASSTANESYIVDFTTRVAGIAPGMDISIQNVMGLGAAIDTLGQDAEVSATTFSQAMTQMYRKTDEFAAVAGMKVKDFKQLMEEDANEAFLKFLEGLGSQSMEKRVEMLDAINLRGQRATQILGVLADNTALLREQQAISNTEFEKANAILEEFNTKNETPEAKIEKRRKIIDRAVADIGEKLFPVWSGAIGLSGNLLKALSAIVGVMAKYGASILWITGAIVAHNVVQKIRLFYSQANRTAMIAEVATLKTATASTQLFTAAKLLLAGSFRAAGVAFKTFLVSLGPVGWAIGIVGLLGGAIAALSSATKDATKSTKDLSDVNIKASESIIEEKMRLEDLLRTASDKSLSDAERLKAMQELHKLLPNGIDLINEETIANGKAKESVDKYIESLLLRAKITAGEEHLIEIEKERIVALENGTNAKLSFWQKIGTALLVGANQQELATEHMTKSAITNMADFEEEFAKRSTNLQKRIKQWKTEIGESTPAAGLGGSAVVPPISLPEKSKKTWSLDDDQEFANKRLELKKRLMSDDIKTEDEHNQILLQLEIDALQNRLSANIESGKEKSKLEQTLADKKYTQQKNEQARLEKLLAISLENPDNKDTEKLIASEQLSYEKRLKSEGLFYKSRKDMTQEELAALLNLERIHTAKVQRIYMDRVEREFNEKKTALDRAITQTKLKHNEELADADTFGKKKATLASWMTSEELGRIKTEKQAAKALTDHYNQVEKQEAEKHLKELLVSYATYMAQVKSMGSIGVTILDEDELKKLQAIIDEVEKKLSDLRGVDPTSDTKEGQDVDILGFSPDKWEQLFENLSKGQMRLEQWQMALELVGQAFGDISKLMVAAEQREFKAYEKTANDKKKTLDRQKKQGLLSEETYQKKVQEIDEETDRRRAEMERKQALRDKAMAVFQATANTAIAITSALTIPPPMGQILAGIVGALGAVQIAAILATPLPGAEEGGYLDVTRAQDGKRFRAKNDPNRRGYVNETSVIVSENGEEHVATAQAVRNPTIRPVLDIIDTATRNGTVGSINLPAIMATTLQGRASGGYVGDKGSMAAAHAESAEVVPAKDMEVFYAMLASLEKLNLRFDFPLLVSLIMNGKSGFHEQYEGYKKSLKNKDM